MSFSKLPPFWINPVYEDGTLIDGQLIEAAREMWPEAVCSTQRWLRDASRTAEIMETAVYQVWTKFLQGSIEDISKIGSYLRRTFYRLLRRIACREEWFICTDPNILGVDRDVPQPFPAPKKDSPSPTDPSQRRTEAARLLWSKRDSRGTHGLIETSLQLHLLLERLSVRERTLLVLFWIEGMIGRVFRDKPAFQLEQLKSWLPGHSGN